MTSAWRIANSVWAGACAGLAALASALAGNESLSQVTAGQWVAVTSATLVTAGGVIGFTRPGASR